jgi:hypothetical protein
LSVSTKTNKPYSGFTNTPTPLFLIEEHQTDGKIAGVLQVQKAEVLIT